MKLLKGVAWSAVRGWGSRFINLAVFFVAARYMTPAEIGVFSLVAAYLLFAQVLGEGGLAEFIVQRSEAHPEQDAAIFYSQFASSTGLAVLIAAVSPWVAPFLVHHEDAVPIFIVSALSIPLIGIIKVPEALSRKALQFKMLAWRGLATSGIAGVVAMAMAYRGFGVWALVVKQVLEAVIDAVLIYAATRWNPGLPRLRREVLAEPFAYGKHILGARLLDTLYVRIDVFLIGHFIGNSALGYYSVGQKIYQALLELLSKVFANVAVPYMARDKADPAAVKRTFLQFIRMVSIVALPAFAFIFMLSTQIIVLMFGERWAEADWILRAFCVLGAVNCVAFFNGHLLMAMGDSKAYFTVLVQKTIMMVGLCLAGLAIGIEGVVAAVVLAGVLVTPLSYLRMRRWIDVHVVDIARAMSRGLAAVAIVVLGVLATQAMLEYRGLYETVMVGLVVMGVAGLGLYVSRDRLRMPV